MNERTINPPVSMEFVAPTQEQLEAKALHYLKTCKPKEYRELKKNGELQQSLTRRAQAARDYARRLILSGEFENQAWNRAIRLEILESESD